MNVDFKLLMSIENLRDEFLNFFDEYFKFVRSQIDSFFHFVFEFFYFLLFWKNFVFKK